MNNKKPNMVMILLVVSLLAPFIVSPVKLSAFGRREQAETLPETEVAEVLIVTGAVRLVGNEPFSELVISGENREWYIAPTEEYKLRDLQQMIVTVEGIETVTNLRFANGFPAGERYTLDRITVKEIH